VQGDLTSINGFLESLTFVPTAGWNGSAEVLVTLENDYTSRGNITSFTVDVTVTAVSDAPTGTDFTVPITEDTPHVFQLSDFGFADVNDALFSQTPDALAAVIFPTVPAAGQGTLTLNGGTVTAGTRVTAADIQAGLLVYTPEADVFGDGHTSFTFQVEDDGSTSNGGVVVSTSANTITFDVAADNDTPPPVDATEVTTKNDAVIFTLTSTEVDTGTDNADDALVTGYKITSLPGNGTLTYLGTDVTLNQIIPADTGTSGRPSADLTFTPTLNFTGQETFTFTAIDAAGAESGNATLTLDVTAENEAPQLTVPGAQGVQEDASLTLNGISITDIDAGSNRVQLDLSVTDGSFTLASVTGLFDAASGGNAILSTTGTSVTLFGTVADLNTALDGLIYTPDPDFSGLASVTITVDDLGNTGPSSQSDSATIQVSVSNLDDSPDTGAATLSTINEDTTAPDGTTVSTLLSGYSDPDGDALAGIAISADASGSPPSAKPFANEGA
jgi:hypothetical protein